MKACITGVAILTTTTIAMFLAAGAYTVYVGMHWVKTDERSTMTLTRALMLWFITIVLMRACTRYLYRKAQGDEWDDQ